MSGIPTPNYVLTEDFSYSSGPQDQRTLSAGTFVRPISTRWVPNHVVDGYQGRWFNPETEKFCFTRYGIIAIPEKILRKV